HLKFTNAPDWTHLIEGDAGNGQLVINSNPPDMVLPGAGFYELVVNTTALTWTAKLTTWGIIGDATPGGWNTDTQLTYNATTGLWTVPPICYLPVLLNSGQIMPGILIL